VVGLGSLFLFKQVSEVVEQMRVWHLEKNRNATIIIGSLQSATGRTRLTDKGVTFYDLSVKYEFKTPAGRTITTTAQRVRSDLSGQPLPPDGTPVAILYATDFNYELI
jgi:hypothetical protein